MADLQGLVDSLANLDDESCVTVICSVLQARPELAPPVVTFAVPELTYPPSKTLVERRSQGLLKTLNVEKGFGWIECQELFNVFGKDVYLHYAQFAGMQPGQPVNFCVVLNQDNKPQAYDLQPGHLKGGFKGGFKGGCCNGPPPDMMGGCGGGFNAGGCGKGMAKDFGQPFNKGCKGGMPMQPMQPMQPMAPMQPMPPMPAAPAAAPTPAMPSNVAPELQNNEVTVLGEYSGSIKSFTPREGFGLIDCPDLKSLYFHDTVLHVNQMVDFRVGDNIQFTAYLNDAGKPQAKELRNPDGSMPGKRPRTDGQPEWGGWGQRP